MVKHKLISISCSQIRKRN